MDAAAAFVFAGGILLMGVILVAIFRENRVRAAQLAAYQRDHARAAARARPNAPAQPAAARRPFVEPEIRERGAVKPNEAGAGAERDRTAA